MVAVVLLVDVEVDVDVEVEVEVDVVVVVVAVSCWVLAQPPIPNPNNQETITRQIKISDDNSQKFSLLININNNPLEGEFQSLAAIILLKKRLNRSALTA